MNFIKTGALPNSSPLIVNVGANLAPMTASLNSAAPGRLIELSSDGGLNYYSPTLDANIASFINVAILAPISHIRFTGAVGDMWSVR